jgi:hypothetical protein
LGEESYHAEWVHDDEAGLVTVYLLDGAARNEVRSASESLVIEVRIGDQTRSHTLPASDRNEDDPPTASRFAVTDKPLIEALKAAGQGVDVRLTVEIGGQPYQASVVHAEHTDGHAH